MADWLLKMCHVLSFHCEDRGKQTAHVLLRLVVNGVSVFFKITRQIVVRLDTV